MSNPAPIPGFVAVEVPARVADLGLRFQRPADWVQVELPEEKVDFDDPLAFLPLAVCMAPYGAIVLSVAARPAYAEGSVAQWLEYLAHQRGLDPGTIETEPLEQHAAVGCWGIQVSDGTVMRARLALFEDGQRLVNVSVMAPQALWASVATVLRTMLRSLALTAPRGATAPLALPGVTLPPSSFTDQAEPAAAGEQRRHRPAPAAPQAPPPPVEPEAPPPPAGPDPESLPSAAADVALAGDASALDPDHPMNARLRDSGAGLTPNVLATDDRERWALVGAGAIVATLRVPFGWHAIDDGKRTLVFDAEGHVQVNLGRRWREGRDDDGVLRQILAGLREEWSQLEHIRLELAGWQCLGIRNVTVNGQPIEQAYLLRDAPHDMVLVTRVTASPDRMVQAMNLAEVLLRDLTFLDAVAS